MLEILDKTYHIGLEQYYDVLEIRSSDTKIRCALVSAQKCLLCLGDLARYKEMIQNTSNYGKARQYYQKASHIDTRNAKPFNQVSNSLTGAYEGGAEGENAPSIYGKMHHSS